MPFQAQVWQCSIDCDFRHISKEVVEKHEKSDHYIPCSNCGRTVKHPKWVGLDTAHAYPLCKVCTDWGRE